MTQAVVMQTNVPTPPNAGYKLRCVFILVINNNFHVNERSV